MYFFFEVEIIKLRFSYFIFCMIFIIVCVYFMIEGVVIFVNLLEFFLKKENKKKDKRINLF